MSSSIILLFCQHQPIILYPSGVGLIWAELGKVYREQGYIIRGVEAFEKAYNIYKQVYGHPDHPEVCAFRNALHGASIEIIVPPIFR